MTSGTKIIITEFDCLQNDTSAIESFGKSMFFIVTVIVTHSVDNQETNIRKILNF